MIFCRHRLVHIHWEPSSCLSESVQFRSTCFLIRSSLDGTPLEAVLTLPWNAAVSSASHLWSWMIDGLQSLGRKSLVVPHLICPGREKATWLPLCLSFLYFFNSNTFSEDVVSNSCPSGNVSCKLILLLKAFGKKHSYHYTFLSGCFGTMAGLFTDVYKGWAWPLHPCEDICVLAIEV